MLALFTKEIHGDKDIFHEMITICLEVDAIAQKTRKKNQFKDRSIKEIDTYLSKKKMEDQKLYNPYRNLYLDKCYGDSEVPLEAWMNFSDFEQF